MQLLFGGAASININDSYINARFTFFNFNNHLYSTIREIPDHQEVFVSKIDDSSIIIEILDMQNKNTSLE